MPKELPGFYYDAEKNRYFPNKGPIPGSSRIKSFSSSSPLIQPEQAKVRKGLGRTTAEMLQIRELYGNVITSAKGKYNFREEYTKRLVSEPTIWRYRGTDSTARALEQLDVIANMPDGDFNTDLLVSGCYSGSLSFYVVDKDTQEFHYGVQSMPDCAWPLDIRKKEGFFKSPGHLWRLDGASVNMSSPISCIKKFGKPGQNKILITTLGSEASGGSVSVLSLSDPLVLRSTFPVVPGNLDEITLFHHTIWTADCNSNGSQALIGTNFGASLVNVETGAQSWVCRSKSDVSSVQLDSSGKIALCGMRNGAIVAIDVRQRPASYARLARQRIPLHSPKQGWFEFNGRIYNSGTTSMPSSVSCLASLKLYDQYFLASSVDGSIKLYDHRMVQRGAVQSYEGNVNSHSGIQLGVDPSEEYVMSGGNDCKVRLWSIKSGELLFEEKFMGSIPLKFCWGKKEDNKHSHFGEAWVASGDGIYLTRW